MLQREKENMRKGKKRKKESLEKYKILKTPF